MENIMEFDQNASAGTSGDKASMPQNRADKIHRGAPGHGGSEKSPTPNEIMREEQSARDQQGGHTHSDRPDTSG
jgi:hypothetical protein